MANRMWHYHFEGHEKDIHAYNDGSGIMRDIMANEKQQSGLMFNALTQGSKIVGNISADSDFRIDGLIEGDLNCTGKVVIGEAGRVKGTIVCQNAEILGLLAQALR